MTGDNAIVENCFLRTPPSRQDAQVCDSFMTAAPSASAGNVDFCPSVHIRPPSERRDGLSSHALMRVVGAREYEEISPRVGDSSRPDLFPIRDSNWRSEEPLGEETLYYLTLLHRDFL